ncbi:expressed protein [Dictyostelium purpureum]|uniref:Expressed protein n=1 Tax=Dictyostelium purpureum TaxID=5786 RepID=F0ZQ07_DICPU|nr:uncharacterized protein DICPUDRAFT_92312 [Dictyostelium purpureum]EGC33964.1 expressed protein [Dictyostelium purpureum]|eukprot:XP_003289497.1 expressed protein [Dictyostelium purpureum]
MKIIVIFFIYLLINYTISNKINNNDNYDCIININNSNGIDSTTCGFGEDNCLTITGAINSLQDYLKTKTCKDVLINIKAGQYLANNSLNLISNNLFTLNSIQSITFFGSTNTIIDGSNTNSSFFNLQQTNIASISFESLNFENWNGIESIMFNINSPSIPNIQISILDCNFSNINSSSIINSIGRLDQSSTKSNINVYIGGSLFSNINTLSNPFKSINTDTIVDFTTIEYANISGSYFSVNDGNLYFSNSHINQITMKQQFITSVFSADLNILFANSTYTNNSLGFLNSTFSSSNNTKNSNNNNNNILIENSSFINNYFIKIGTPLFLLSSADIMIVNTHVNNTGDHIAGDELIIGQNGNIKIWNSTIQSYKPINGHNLTISLFSNNQIDNSTFCFFCFDCNFEISTNTSINSSTFKPMDLDCSSIGKSKRIWIRFALFVVITFILLFVIFYNLYQKFKVCNIKYFFKVSKRKHRLLDDEDEDDIDNYNENSRIINDSFSIL